MNTADYWIEKLQLAPHPEGGYFRETYRAVETVPAQGLPERFSGERNFSTAIYFLLKSGQKSLFHRIKSDEMWHFYSGSSLTIHMISATGNYANLPLGAHADAGQLFQQLVPAGAWFGATVDDAESYSLVGCTVAPGFDFADFEFGESVALSRLCPTQKRLVELMTKV